MSDPPMDDEMLELFRVESREHLERMEQGLLQLEDDPEDTDALDAVRREAHGLKGSARMLGLEAVERLSHRFEDVLETARDEGGVGAHRVDTLYEAIDGLRSLCEAVLEGTDAEVDVDAVVANLDEGLDPSTADGDAPPAEPTETEGPAEATGDGEDETEPGEPGETEAPPEAAAGEDDAEPEEPGEDPLSRARSHQIDTVRVDPDRLDRLMRHAGELVVTKQRLERLQADLEDVARTAADAGRGRATRTSGPAQSSTLQPAADLMDRLETLSKRMQTDTSRLDSLSEAIQEGVEETRLLPMSTIFTLFPRAVRDLAQEAGKDVDLVLEGEDVRADKQVLEELKDPLMHLVRNAVAHGIEAPDERRDAGKDPTGTVRLTARRSADRIQLEVADDGAGIDPETVRAEAREGGVLDADELEELTDDEVVDLVFRSGFSTQAMITDVSGRGVGLDAVAESVDQLDGELSLTSHPGEGTTVRIEVPVRVSTLRAVLVEAADRPYAIPMASVDRVTGVEPDDVYALDGRSTIQVGDEPVPVAVLGEVLDLPDHRSGFAQRRPCVVVDHQGSRFGLLVDDLVGEQEMVVEPLGGVLRNVRNVAGATVLDDGQVCIVLDAGDLARSQDRRGPVDRAGPADDEAAAEAESEEDEGVGPTLLLVEDTIMTRTQLKRILEGEGYEVVTAADGVAALAALDGQDVDGVVTDIDMPNMGGLELTRELRSDPATEDLPVILVTTREDEETKREGMEAGANAYIEKGRFDQSALVETLGRLIG